MRGVAVARLDRLQRTVLVKGGAQRLRHADPGYSKRRTRLTDTVE
jgi:hypothetical protein